MVVCDGGFVIYGNFMIHDGPDDLVSDAGWGGAGCIEVCGASGFSDLKKLVYNLSGSSKTNQDQGIKELVEGLILDGVLLVCCLYLCFLQGSKGWIRSSMDRILWYNCCAKRRV